VFKSSVKKVKTDKLALWGSSFGGGHVIVTAATHPNKEKIAAVVSQVPNGFPDQFSTGSVY
jgi:cephalosporin-C deacetylase-like acetyl esterase